MICEQCGLRLVECDVDWGEVETRYALTCPNFTSAFMEFIRQEQLTKTYEMLGQYACERMYELPLYYVLV